MADFYNSPLNAPAPTPSSQMAKLELVRAFWPEADERVDEGTIFEIDAMTAIDLIQSGVAKKADPDAAVTRKISFDGGKLQ